MGSEKAPNIAGINDLMTTKNRQINGDMMST